MNFLPKQARFIYLNNKARFLIFHSIYLCICFKMKINELYTFNTVPIHGLLTRSYTLRQLTPEDSPGILSTVSIGCLGHFPVKTVVIHPTVHCHTFTLVDLSAADLSGTRWRPYCLVDDQPNWQLLCCCFMALRLFSGHFGCGQLTYPHCSWASLLCSLPVLSGFFGLGPLACNFSSHNI